MGFETIYTYRNAIKDKIMSEYKKCPHCGEEILAVAKKCKYCREWIVDDSTNPPKREEPIQSGINSEVIFFKTHVPDYIEKDFSMHTVNPQKWLLDEFRLENGILTISTLDGNMISGPVDEMKIRIQTDDYSGRVANVWYGKHKLKFKEMSGLLSDEEWSALFGTMSGFPNVGEAVVGKTVKVFGKIVTVLSMIIVVGVALWKFVPWEKIGSSKQDSFNVWKPWVLSRAKVEDYTPIDLVLNYTEDRVMDAKFVDYIDKYEFWWIENGDNPIEYEDSWVSSDFRMSEMEGERNDFNTYYYPVLARLTLINALLSDSDGEGNDDEEDMDDALTALYLKMMGKVGDALLLSSFFEAAEERMDLDNLRKLSREDLRKSMDQVLDEHGFSLYRIVLQTDDENDGKWWGADNVANLAMEYKNEFFENIMAILSDFSGLEQLIDEAVSVYSYEYNSELSSNKAKVYDVIYSIKDKMYVKCSVLESDGRSEIKINSKSASLLSL